MCETAKTWLEMYESKYTGECAKFILEPMRVKFKNGGIRTTGRHKLYFYDLDSIVKFIEWLECKDAPYRLGEMFGGRRVTNHIKYTIDIVKMFEGAEVDGRYQHRCSDIDLALVS